MQYISNIKYYKSNNDNYNNNTSLTKVEPPLPLRIEPHEQPLPLGKGQYLA